MSWWELAKRHKGKIVAGSAIIGGTVAVVLQYRDRHAQIALPEEGLQARRHYVFDANHAACDESIRELAPSVARVVQGRVNVEQLTRQLQEGNLTPERKIELWNELKVAVVSRILALSHSLALLTLALKAQISILAAEIVAGGGGAAKSKGWFSWLPEGVCSLMGGASEVVGQSQRNDAARQVFLRSIEYLVQSGVLQLAGVIEEVVRGEMKEIRLESVRDEAGLLSLLSLLSAKVYERIDSLSIFVAPLEKDDVSSDAVSVLLRRLISILDSKLATETHSKLVEFYLTAATRGLSKGALAVQLSSLSSSFPRLSSIQKDDPLDASLYSSDVHRFAIQAFNTPIH